MKNKGPLIILGSSRPAGRTRKIIRELFPDDVAPVVDLAELKMSYYDYAHANRDDDFIPLAERMVQHDPLILATPVYWYTMSAVMKTFLDRWTDLLEIRKDLGRALKGKNLYVLSSYAVDLPQGFEDAFRQTCDYMDMHYRGCFYYYTGDDALLQVQNGEDARAFSASIL